MRILYGVQGTGNGHITRARAMAKAMADQGLAVDYLFSGRAADQFFDMEPFGDYRLCKGLTSPSRRVDCAVSEPCGNSLRAGL